MKGNMKALNKLLTLINYTMIIFQYHQNKQWKKQTTKTNTEKHKNG